MLGLAIPRHAADLTIRKSVIRDADGNVVDTIERSIVRG